ncbi:MAG: quinoprotein dehydrogenase-associated SoxYZ-like carrier [Geminicoccaceae bacterium]|nr:quinoprotein dehydrogenase-associated SoxYZ-like carrier [Geminicoccaceae bacterium]
MRARPSFILAAFAIGLAAMPVAAEEAAPMQPSESWDSIRYDVVGDRELKDGDALYTIEVPFRAFDAAAVPVRVIQEKGAPDVARMTLVIDENPSPVAADFTFGPTMRPLDLETRVRVDAYSNVRAIVETVDGDTYMTGRFVRASGGCSAPAAKDAEAALANLGQMKMRWFDPANATEVLPQSRAQRTAQIMLRHPNYSGLQRDQVTHLFVPAHFVDRVEIRQGDEMLFTMEGGISISEDPAFRFTFVDTGDGPLSVVAHDTEGETFEGSFSVATM